jgi:hypothetical protein
MSANPNPGSSDAARQALGPLVAEHAAGSGHHRWSIIAGGVLTIVLLAGAVAAAVSGINGMGWVALALALVSLLPAAGMAVMIRRLKWRALLYRDGLVLECNGPPQVLPWSDVKYFRERNVNGRYSVRLQLTNQRLITLDPTFRNFHDLAAGIREGVTRTVLIQAARQLEQGQEVAFGSLKVSRAGLRNGDDRLDWEEVSELGVALNFSGSGYKVQVSRKGAQLAWFSRPCIEFPNLEAFLGVASQFTKVTRPG